MKSRLFIVVLLLFQGSLFAQENYQPGFVIIGGDTVRGFIDYRNWERNPNKIQFKTALDANAVSYEPLQVERFSVAGENYTGVALQVESSPFRDKELDNTPALHYRTDTVFIRSLVEGVKNLYYYVDQEGRIYFAIGEKGSYETLMYKRYLKEKDGTMGIVSVPKYLGQLSFYLKDCAVIQSEIKGLRYSEAGFLKLFKTYYACTHNQVKYTEAKEGIKLKVGVVAGIAISNGVAFSGKAGSATLDALTRSKFNTSTDFVGGLSFDIILPRSQGKSSIYNELLYTSYKFSATDVFINQNFQVTTAFKLEESFIKLNNLYRHKIPLKKMFIFLNGGFSSTFVMSGRIDNVHTETITPTATTVTDGRWTNELSYQSGFVFGAGATVKNIIVEVRTEFGNGISSAYVVNSPINRYYFLLGYRF